MDHEVTFFNHILVASIDLILDPVGELVLEKGHAHVGDVLLWNPRKLERRLWQVLVHVRIVLIQKLPNLLDAEPLVPVVSK